RPPRERGREGQLLLSLPQQGRPRLRDPRSARGQVPGALARALFRRARRLPGGPDPLLPRPRARGPAAEQVRRRVRHGQPRLRAERRARRISRAPGVGVYSMAGTADHGAAGGAGARRDRGGLPAGAGGPLPGGGFGGRDSAHEGLEGHRRARAVRGRAQAVSHALRGAVMSVAPGTTGTTRVDVDAELVEALRREDPDAAERLVERFGDRVYRLAMRITGSREDAEEAAQDALWTAARKIQMFKGESAFGSWIYRITANAAYQKLRTRRRTANEVALDDVLPSFDSDGRHFEPMDDWSNRVDEQALQGELRQALTAAIDALPVDYRTALALHDVEGVSNPD